MSEKKDLGGEKPILPGRRLHSEIISEAKVGVAAQRRAQAAKLAKARAAWKGRGIGVGMPVPVPIHRMANARVVDLVSFHKAQSRPDLSNKNLARWLGVPLSTAAKLLAGKHWQQDSELIAKFNEFRGTDIPVSGPEMGIPSPEVLELHGGASGKRRIQVSPGERWAIDAAKKAGIDPAQVAEVGRRHAALAGADVPVLERLDTAYFLEATEQKLARFLRALDDQMIATMSGSDLVKAVSVFIEKRALLRGEPTQIVSHRDRVALDAVLPLLVEAARKRGVVIDQKARAAAGPADG